MLKKYSLLYLDCPWEFQNKQSGNTKRGAYTYPSMTFEEIGKLPIENIADKNCALVMWSVSAKLPEIFEMVKTYWPSFNFTTVLFNWVKLNPTGSCTKVLNDLWLQGGIYSGMGSWSANSMELCLLFKRGKLERFDKSVKQALVEPVTEQYLIEPRGKHSAKPLEAKTRLLRIFGEDIPRLEMFARDKTHGFDVWGNELENDINIEDYR